jgi:hypothetical protein
MADLYAALADRVTTWRLARYPQEQFPAIAEILLFATDDHDVDTAGTGPLRYLRAAQLRALETYWYLRLVEGTPRIPELYRRLFPTNSERLKALGLDKPVFKDIVVDASYDALVERILTDDAFAKTHRLDALRETLALDYPSWILALAMGAGKTVLIGAIIATEFALALEYPDAADDGGPTFIENALVFAPGTTILESLRELSRIPFDRLLPDRLHGPFAASLKITYTRDGERDIPVIRGSRFNLVVTNTEKIRIQARPRRRNGVGSPVAALFDRSEEEAREVANLRLQAIASLPHLGIFSDEAHHTYGRSLGTDLKRVRQTVDYLASETNVVAVVNTTGTPYFERQPLRDVVVWYGLRQGIADGVLKEVAENIRTYDFVPDQADEMVAEVVRDFFEAYRDHRLPNGAPAKLAIYFPQNDDLDALEPHVQLAVARAGFAPTVVLRNTSRSTSAEIDAFNRLNDPEAPHRVILLVNKGTEGWNCPSLFATALARKLRTSNNFVLQAATRCLRQIPGNVMPARIYLSSTNRTALDQQLTETYGESLGQIDGTRRVSVAGVIRLRKPNLPTIRIRRSVQVLERAAADETAHELTLTAPKTRVAAGISVSVFDVGLSAASRRVLRQVGEAITIDTSVDTIDIRTAAHHLAANYRLELWPIVTALGVAYDNEPIPVAALDDLARQLEASLGGYTSRTVEEETELAIVRPGGFDEAIVDGVPVRQAEISYPADKAHLIWPVDKVSSENPGDYGFHYSPYNFDSRPEADFYERTLRALNLTADEVQDVYFTGAITDPKKTDLVFAYQRDGRTHSYTPDFVVHASDDRWMLVEVKMTARRNDPVEGQTGVKAAALRDLEARNPGRVFFKILFADDAITAPDVAAVAAFLVDGTP